MGALWSKAECKHSRELNTSRMARRAAWASPAISARATPTGARSEKEPAPLGVEEVENSLAEDRKAERPKVVDGGPSKKISKPVQQKR